MPRLSKIGAAALAAFGWTGLSSVSASYLQVAGGGGGGYSIGGGGGAGGYRTGTSSLNPTLSYTVTVGAGGSGGVSGSSAGSNGADSVFNAITSTGGGGGGGNTDVNGKNGGSGGGSTVGATAGNGNTPSTSPSQGNNGGTAANTAPFSSAGGGGASAVGVNANPGTGNGGAGSEYPTSSGIYYAGGGGGGRGLESLNGTGGLGGGGNGGISANGSPGTANTGGGGGGGGNGAFNGGNGGSGVVIISYPSPQKFGGGIVTTSGSNTIHTFTTSGTLSPLSTLTANFLVVAGGGGGGAYNGGGGGAGGLRSSVTNTGGGGSLESSLTIDTNSIYTVTVGAGGIGAIGSSSTAATSGGNSVFNAITSIGGGQGAFSGSPERAATTGGSGGGGANGGVTAGAAGTANQGRAGGNGQTSGFVSSGGGGGASTVGTTAPSSNVGGAGGNGVASSITGSSVTYAGGGGGGTETTGGTGGAGGAGGGGSGANGTVGGAGTANTGGGGGGSQGGSSTTGGAGGSGIVIISYAGATQLMAGGTVTISGGNVIHTFTSSGYLTPLTLVGNSLRFRSSASAYLNRTPTTASNRTTWTWSGWVKLGLLTPASGWNAIFGAYSDDNNRTFFYTNNNIVSNAFYFFNVTGGSTTSNLISTQLLRDPAAWYHIVVAIDTTQATSSDRVKIYLNGNQITAFGTATYPSGSANFMVNNNVAHYIGASSFSGINLFHDGYMTEVRLIDGQALTPNSFGTFNSYGVWQPIRYGGSYGTNGFYLPFTATQSFTGIFSGSSQWVSLPNLAAYSVGTSNYTVEGWFYITSLGATQGLFGCNNGSGSTPKFLGLVNTSGAVLLEFTNSGGATFLTSSSGVVTTNKWHHIAWVRNSGTSTIYVNGTAVGSTATSVNLAGLTQAWNIGYIGESGPSSLTGNASNFRLVTGTAVYTSNFIPQTTPLTAISGTQILTLQNATLVDNSTNAQVVTNNGGVTVGATYPFAMLNDVVKDFGPAGNNWTANNIGETTGSTLDTMTDVPTLTSTTAANYAVLNPLDQGTSGNTNNGNISYNNTSTVVWNGVRASFIIPKTGEWYWEAYILATPMDVSIVAATANLNSTGYNDTYSYSYGALNGEYRYSGASQGSVATYTTGDTIAYYINTGVVRVYKNNNLIATWSQNLSAYSGDYFPAVFTNSTSANNGVAINFGQQPWKYTPPGSALALNTFNL